LGFLELAYNVEENRGPVDLEIGVVAGSYQVHQDINIPAALSLVEGTATGNFKF